MNIARTIYNNLNRKLYLGEDVGLPVTRDEHSGSAVMFILYIRNVVILKQIKHKSNLSRKVTKTKVTLLLNYLYAR